MKYTKDLTFFEKIDNEVKAYFLGLLYADGYNYNNRFVIIGLQKEDKAILEKIAAELYKGKFPLYEYVYNNSNWKDQIKLQISSRKISLDLANLGCHQNKSHTLLFPSENIIPFELKHHFLRGYFDGDGCVYNGKRKKCKVKDKKSNGELYYRISIIHNVKFQITGCFNFVDEYQNQLVKELSFKKNKLSKCRNSFTMEYSGRKQMEKFYNYLYKDANFYFTRKKEKFENTINCADIQ